MTFMAINGEFCMYANMEFQLVMEAHCTMDTMKCPQRGAPYSDVN
jgi:hypothetical protein